MSMQSVRMEIKDTHSVSPGFAGLLPLERPPKYFGVDVDGTFHTKNEGAWRRNIEAFAEVRKRGFTPFFSTGRSLVSALRLVGEEFKAKTGYHGYPGVYNNGAVVYDGNGSIISLGVFSREFMVKFCDFLTCEGLVGKCIFYTDNYEFSLVEVDDDLRFVLQSRHLGLPEIKPIDEILEMSIVGISLLCKEINIPGLERDVDYVEKHVEDDFYDLSTPNTTKGQGVAVLLEHLGATFVDFGYIGDGDNDTENMDLSSLSFAVANAPNHVKEHAKFVLDMTCDEAAVAEVFKRIYKL
ncbi:haloacid dehalogenase-like hydrolase family member protein [Theileria equi strain WA]|uniref:Haloacid dehalogenase-like hydrolase family member protein n=1 Tax=Theileria equi strain WA TaxID=1537102 RepID=L1LB33_THEEQ|nr:haloacid dehalogenase-like hydrolase family member protein [Theileria equi strain WA]EKX72479.1 haloacid dehalogenase-like hydrolase family member protein [Theileria equi strain WA]|eukprot:XP_004831931.1 haloacid dehalogenase-like hydrolase family member protein [Theileria equi strain WA]